MGLSALFVDQTQSLVKWYKNICGIENNDTAKSADKLNQLTKPFLCFMYLDREL